MGTQGYAAFFRWFPRYPLLFCTACKMPDINVVSTTKRIVEMLDDGSKKVSFKFCKFREY